MEKSYKEQALKLVRDCCEELRELSFGCVVKCNSIIGDTDIFLSKFHSKDLVFASQGDYGEARTAEIKEIIGHPPQLNHWLRLLGEPIQSIGVQRINDTLEMSYGHKNIKFNLKDGQPSTEADYQAILDICS